MSSIAVITNNVYDGLELFEEITIPAIRAQSTHDFTWYFLDAHLDANRETFARLTKDLPFRVHHLPLMHATHYPHAFIWEPYNSALLVAKENIIFRWGMYRRYHPKAVESVRKLVKDGFAVDFSQDQMGPDAKLTDSKLRNERGETHGNFCPACGMFAAKRNDMIYRLNGNDEVGLHWLHFEDVEMGARASRSGMKMVRLEGWLDRFWHLKPYFHDVNPPIPQPDMSQWSPPWFKNKEMGTFETIKAAEAETGLQGKEACATMIERKGCRRIPHRDYDGFWFHEPDGSLGHSEPWGDAYRDWVIASNHVKSIIGIGGFMIGRNLAYIESKLKGVKDVAKRVEIVMESWSDPKAFQE